MAYASSDAHLLQGSVRENLLYSLKHAPFIEHVYTAADATIRQWEIAEAKRAGNPTFDLRSDWIDYAAAGVKG